MTSIEDFIIDLEKLKGSFGKELPFICERIAADAYALIKSRIRDTGTNANGVRFGQYSENALNPEDFKGKELNAGGAAAVAKARKAGTGLSYKDFRTANGLEVKYVNFSFTNQTLNDVGVVQAANSNGRIVIFVGPENQVNHDGISTADILDQLEERFGDIIDVSDKEQSEINLSLEDEINKLTSNFL